jgi:hypothetical protein
MGIGEKVAEELNSKHGYAYENNDETATYKEVVPGKIWFYFGKEDEDGGPYYGYWAENVSDATRHNLSAALSDFSFQDDGETEDNGAQIYRTVDLSKSSSGEDTLVRGMINKMKKVESQYHEVMDAAL